MTLSSILVLEDDENYQGVLVDTLEDNGYSALGVASAAEAIKHAAEEHFDIVLSDVRMAGSLDGLGALEVLKKRQPELKCIVMTGFASEDAPLRALNIEVDDYLYKPFETAKLFSAIDHLRKRGQSAISQFMERFQERRLDGVRQQLRQERYAAWNFIRVAIRSRIFTAAAVDGLLTTWDALEPIELEYHRALQNEHQIGPDTLKELAQRYHSFVEYLRLRLAGHNLPAPRSERTPGMMTREALRVLIKQVNSDLVSVEDLHLAVWSWRVPSAQRAEQAVIEQTFQRLWPELADKRNKAPHSPA